MSHSANNITAHRLHPSSADCTTDREWGIYIGPLSGFLFIVGPGEKAMRRVTRTPNEHFIEIARNCVILLNQTKREDVSAGPAEILEALIAVGYENCD